MQQVQFQHQPHRCLRVQLMNSSSCVKTYVLDHFECLPTGACSLSRTIQLCIDVGAAYLQRGANVCTVLLLARHLLQMFQSKQVTVAHQIAILSVSHACWQAQR